MVSWQELLCVGFVEHTPFSKTDGGLSPLLPNAVSYNRKRTVILGWVRWQFIFLAGSLVLEFCCLESVSALIPRNLTFSYNSLASARSLHTKWQSSEPNLPNEVKSAEMKKYLGGSQHKKKEIINLALV